MTDEADVVVGAELRRSKWADSALSRAASLSVTEASAVREPGGSVDGTSGGGAGTVVGVEMDMMGRITVDTDTKNGAARLLFVTASTRRTTMVQYACAVRLTDIKHYLMS